MEGLIVPSKFYGIVAADDAGAGLAASELVEGVHVHRVWTSRFGRDWLPGRAIDYLSYYISVAWCLSRLLSKGDVVVAKTYPRFYRGSACVINGRSSCLFFKNKNGRAGDG